MNKAVGKSLRDRIAKLQSRQKARPRRPTREAAVSPMPEGTPFAVLTVVFDVTGSKNLWRNYWNFRNRLDSRVDLHTIEISFDGAFNIPDSNKVIANENQKLWQKEQAIKQLLSTLDEKYEYVMWMDADSIFRDKQWLDRTYNALQTADIVFPYCNVLRLGQTGGADRKSIAAISHRTNKHARRSKHVDLAYGIACAFRREWLDQHGLVSWDLSGSGDCVEYYAALGDTDWGLRNLPTSLHSDWEQRVEEVKGAKISCVAGEVVHQYHGLKGNRQYITVREILNEHRFEPSRDVKVAENGLWEWSGSEETYAKLSSSFDARLTDDCEPLIAAFRARFGQSTKIELPGDVGVLSACDAAYFTIFQALYWSIAYRYNVEITVVDLGMTDRQREWCSSQPQLTVISPPSDWIIDRGEKAWQLWSKPLYIRDSPHRRTIWLDADTVVGDSCLVQLSRNLLTSMFTAECVSDWKRADRKRLPHEHFGTMPVDDNLLVMAGICGFDTVRDRAFIEKWITACRSLKDVPRGDKRLLNDQEALQWLVDVEMRAPCVLRGKQWNYATDTFDSITPERFAHTLERGPHIFHFYGQWKQKPVFWREWGEVIE